MTHAKVSPDWDMSDPQIRYRAVLTTLMPGFRGESLPEGYRKFFEDGLGALCLFGQNVSSPQQLRELNHEILAANPRALIAIDEEGGDVTRLHHLVGSPFPGNAILGRIDDGDLTEEVAHQVGRELADVDVSLDFAPDVDINSNPDNPVIGVRSFGSDPDNVARHSVRWISGFHAAGPLACVKHFPGHGDTSADSHKALPVIDRSLDELRERELIPFKAAIQAGVSCVMTSHILLPQLDATNPATFSSRILEDLLRDELGFSGVIVSDALDMVGASGDSGIPQAAVRALAAGCDLLCLGSAITLEELRDVIDAIIAAIENGQLPAQRVEQAARRVHALVTQRTRVPFEVPISDSRPNPLGPEIIGRIQGAFDTKETVFSHRAEKTLEPELPALPTVVRIESTENVAVGSSPWGPFAVTTADSNAPTLISSASVEEFASYSVVTINEHDSVTSATRIAAILNESTPQGSILAIGKNIHRDRYACDVIDVIRRNRRVIVVDMGWPDNQRHYADIATFGASRVVGEALIDFLVPRLSPIAAHHDLDTEH